MGLILECEYKYVCPIQNCDKNKKIECIGLLVDFFQNSSSSKKDGADTPPTPAASGRAVWFMCDQKACTECDYPKCRYTEDPMHALNFFLRGRELFEHPID